MGLEMMEPIPVIGPVCSDLGGYIKHFHTTIVHVDTVLTGMRASIKHTNMYSLSCGNI